MTERRGHAQDASRQTLLVRVLCVVAAVLAFGFARPAAAQSNAEVVANCGTPNETYSVGQHMPRTQDTNGNGCMSSAGGSTAVVGNQSNAGAGTTGSTNLGTNSYNYGWSGAAWAQVLVDGSGRWLVTGAGTAGTPAGGVLTVQGASGGAVLPVGGATSNAGSAVASSASNVGVVSYLYGFNGTTWDQLEVDAAKNLNIDLCGPGSTTCAGVSGLASDGISSSSNGLTTRGFGYIYNGTTWDRSRSAASAAGTTGTGVSAAGQMVFDGTNYQNHHSDTSGTAYVAVLPPGTAETCSSGNVANSTVACTLATASGKTTYIDGFIMTSNGATASAAVTCTLTGTITGTMSFTYTYQALATIPSAPLNVQFNPPIPASSTNTTIVASCPAGGTGAANATMSAWGGQR